MADHVIVGAGASGLYTAYRLLKDGALPPGDTVRVFEWSERPGGRIYTYTFPEDVGGSDGLYCEFGGMRFATDPNFPESTVEGHRIVQSLIIDLGLAERVVPFGKSDNRLYYLRGENVYEDDLTLRKLKRLPYRFNSEFLKFLKTNKVKKPYTADTIIGAIAGVFAPGLGDANEDRARWCDYFAHGTVPEAGATPTFPAGTPARDIGYWNLLYDQLGDEGYDYAADGNGYSSNVIDWNAADAFENNNDVGSTTSFMRLDGGYSILFEKLAEEVARLAKKRPGSGIFYGQQLTELRESGDGTTTCTFVDHLGSRGTHRVEAHRLFLAMPRRALELVAAGCPADYLLNDDRVKYYLEASINQPAIKIVMLWDEAWWTNPKICKHTPQLEWPNGGTAPPPAQRVGGPTITDLPLRMVDYFANNVPGGPGKDGGPYVLLASYDDMTFSSFWRVMEQSGDYEAAPSTLRQPLKGPTSVPTDSPLAHLLVKQLAETHGAEVENVPAPRAVYYQDWGQDPFGAGYHGWAAHYNICDVMDRVRAPYQRILHEPARHTYVIGSCYSFDQGWVEGALCVAESVLREFLDFAPLNPDLERYTLVCHSKPERSEPSKASKPSKRSKSNPSSRSPKARNSPR